MHAEQKTNWPISQFSLKSKASKILCLQLIMTSQEQINVILQGLPPKHDALVTFISSKIELLQIEYFLA